MLVAPCPRCHESVRVPDAILQASDSSAQAQCPWCLATMGGDELQAALPPAMVVVGVANGAPVAAASLMEQPAGLAAAAMGAAAGVAGLAGAGLASAASLGEDQPQDQPLGELDDTQLDASEFASMETVADEDGGFIETKNDDDDVQELSEMDGSREDANELPDIEPVATTQFDGLTTERIEVDQDNESEHDGLAATELLDIRPGDMEDVPDELMIKETEVVSTDSMMDVDMVRRRSRKGGGLKTALSVVGGGLVALPIVGGILLAAGRAPRLGFYPFDGSFNSGAAQRTASAPAPRNPAPNPVQSPPEGRSLAEDLGPPETFEPDPAAMALDELTNGTAVDSLEPAVESLVPGDSEPALAMPEPPSVEAIDEPAIDEPAIKMSLPETPDEPAAEPEPAAPEPAAPEPAEQEPAAPEFDVASEVKAVSEVLTKLESLEANDPRREQAVRFAYASLAKLAEQAPSSANDELRPLLSRIKSSGTLMREMALAAPAWIEKPASERPTNGALVVGKMMSDGASLMLSSQKIVPVTVPEDVTGKLSGVQIGLGQIRDNNGNPVIDLTVLEAN